jgi:hypothetical protein
LAVAAGEKLTATACHAFEQQLQTQMEILRLREKARRCRQLALAIGDAITTVALKAYEDELEALAADLEGSLDDIAAALD